MRELNPSESFGRYFQVVPADTPASREQVHRIRYQVYCREFGYERDEDCPGGLEQDAYDAQSRHSLLIHRPSGIAAGCVRLVLSRPDDPAAALPFERYCSASLDRSIVDPRALPPGSFGEFSRLAVLGSFRRRKTDEHRPVSVGAADEPDPEGQRCFPHIPVGLFLTALALFLDSGLQTVFAMMEPRLERLLRRYGILFTPVGEVMDYHGPRGPFMMRRETLLPNLTPEAADLLGLIRQQLADAARGACLIQVPESSS